MLVKHDAHIKEVATSCPAPGDKAWIDLSGEAVSQLKDIVATLKWNSEVLNWLDLTPDRAQIQYIGNVSAISVFVPEDRTMKSLGILLGPGIIITIHPEPLSLLENMAKELPNKSELLDSAHYLLYEILERLADSFLELMDHYEEQFDALEEAVLDGQDRAHDIFALRHQLHRLRGVLADMRRIAARLSRRQFTTTAAGMGDANIFVDVYDGFYHVMDNIDSLRDNLTGLVDLQLNQRSTRLNEIMKFLTIFSTIFLPLSFITGFFGMNLRSMPELGLPFGQEVTILVMVLVAVGMLWVFKRRKWM